MPAAPSTKGHKKPKPLIDFLFGWKAIALFLGKHPETVQRWAEERAMPVGRLMGKSVFSTKKHLSQWQGREYRRSLLDQLNEDKRERLSNILTKMKERIPEQYRDIVQELGSQEKADEVLLETMVSRNPIWLTGWAQIARVLGVDRQTVKRWADHEGLPFEIAEKENGQEGQPDTKNQFIAKGGNRPLTPPKTMELSPDEETVRTTLGDLQQWVDDRLTDHTHNKPAYSKNT